LAITDEKADLISLHGENLNWFIERGVAPGPVLEVTVKNVEEAKARLVRNGCVIIKDDPNSPRCYVKDPYGLTYNLTIWDPRAAKSRMQNMHSSARLSSTVSGSKNRNCAGERFTTLCLLFSRARLVPSSPVLSACDIAAYPA
jgi:hypothetical protein